MEIKEKAVVGLIELELSSQACSMQLLYFSVSDLFR